MPKLTPLDIRNQEFPQRFRGYDPDEVDTFLELIADDAEALAQERTQLSERVTGLENQLAEFREMEQSLRGALVMAEKMSSEAAENSQRRIESMLREAEVKALSIIGEAESRARDIVVDSENRRRALLLELEALESQRAYAISKFRNLLDDQRAVLEAHLMSRPMPAGSAPQTPSMGARAGSMPGGYPQSGNSGQSAGHAPSGAASPSTGMAPSSSLGAASNAGPARMPATAPPSEH